jgi:hypothetical protein
MAQVSSVILLRGTAESMGEHVCILMLCQKDIFCLVPGLRKAREEKHNLHAIIIDCESLCLRLHDSLQVGKHLLEKVKELKIYGLWFSPMSRLTKNEGVYGQA